MVDDYPLLKRSDLTKPDHSTLYIFSLFLPFIIELGKGGTNCKS